MAANRRRHGTDIDSTRAGLRLLLSPPVLFVSPFSPCSRCFPAASIISPCPGWTVFGTDLTVANLALTAYLFGTSGGILLGGWIADRTRHHDWVAASCFASPPFDGDRRQCRAWSSGIGHDHGVRRALCMV